MSDHFVPTSLASQRFGRYPEYRDSGVEWLGEIPIHWEVSRLKNTISGCQNGVWGSDPDGRHDIACVRVADFDRNTFSVDVSALTLRSVPPRAASTHRVRPGDLLLEKSGGGERQPVGVVVILADNAPVVCSNFIARMPVHDEYSPSFLVYLHAALYSSRVNLRSIKQSIGIQNLDSESYLNELVGLPPLHEQREIARLLDSETARIDVLVAKQHELIKLLKEKRTALIIHTVTKGLDPDVPMKDSGVEWLGQIPAHWQVQRLRTLASITTGGRDTIDRQHDGRYPFFVRSPVVERIDTWSFDGEAVLTAGDGVGVAKVFHYANGRFDFHQRVYKFSDFDKVIGKFFFRYFGALLRFETLQGTAKSTVDSLRLPMLQNFPVVVPSLSEQHAIIAFLNHETARIDTMIAKVNEAIERLNEYRTALISAAVTGQIDVRHHGDHTVSDNTPTPQARP